MARGACACREVQLDDVVRFDDSDERVAAFERCPAIDDRAERAESKRLAAGGPAVDGPRRRDREDLVTRGNQRSSRWRGQRGSRPNVAFTIEQDEVGQRRDDDAADRRGRAARCEDFARRRCA